MFWIIIVRLFFEAMVLRLVLLMIAKHEADASFAKVAMVTAGILFGGLAMNVLLADKLAANALWVLGLVDAGLAALLIMAFCWVSFGKSLLVVLIYSVIHFAISFALMALVANAMDPDESPLRSWVRTGDQEQQAAKKPPKKETKPSSRKAAAKPQPKADASKDGEEKGGLVAAVKSIFPGSAGDADEENIDAGEARPPEPAQYPPGWPGAQQQLVLSRIVFERGGKQRVAVVNDRILGAGATIDVLHDGATYRFRVRSIGARDVDWERVEVLGDEG